MVRAAFKATRWHPVERGIKKSALLPVIHEERQLLVVYAHANAHLTRTMERPPSPPTRSGGRLDWPDIPTHELA